MQKKQKKPNTSYDISYDISYDTHTHTHTHIHTFLSFKQLSPDVHYDGV